MMSSIRLLGRCPANFRLSGALGALVLVGLLAQTTPSQAAPKTKESRELQAREAFATGRYQEAIELYGKLYAEKLHPTYLRNIGRCYQKLKEPEKAIDSFRDYLGRVKNIPAAEKSEIEGYIAEMEALKKKQDADKAAAAAHAAVVAPVVAPVPRLEPAAPAPQTQLLAATPPPAPESTPFYKRGWFWGVTAGVVAVAVVGALWAAGVFSKSFDPCAGRPGCVTAAGGQ
jgi:ferric-dicitrate binding protein FerR (iron transport regulator)